MITHAPNVSDKDYYPIGVAAELLQVHRNTLRVAAENNYIECMFNKFNHRRVFTGKAIRLYWQKMMGLV